MPTDKPRFKAYSIPQMISLILIAIANPRIIPSREPSKPAEKPETRSDKEIATGPAPILLRIPNSCLFSNTSIINPEEIFTEATSTIRAIIKISIAFVVWKDL
ncbi:hypothetical protein ES708_30525 [subsurface metagenome]